MDNSPVMICRAQGRTTKLSSSEIVYSNNPAKESNGLSPLRMGQPSRLQVKLRLCSNRLSLSKNKNNGTGKTEISG